jgi:hypothetical protein
MPSPQSLVALDDHPPFGDLTCHSKWSCQAQGYLTLRIASADGAPLVDRGGRMVARAYIAALGDAIRFTMMDYCAGRAMGSESGGRPTFALLLAPPPEVVQLAGRSALVYGHGSWQWAAQEVLAPGTSFTSFAPLRLPLDESGQDAWLWSDHPGAGLAHGRGVGLRCGEFADLTEALSAALAAGYLLLAAILERVETALGTAWRPVTLA